MYDGAAAGGIAASRACLVAVGGGPPPARYTSSPPTMAWSLLAVNFRAMDPWLSAVTLKVATAAESGPPAHACRIYEMPCYHLHDPNALLRLDVVLARLGMPQHCWWHQYSVA